MEGSAKSLEPHRITFYLIDLVGRFHSYYNKTRVLGNDPEADTGTIVAPAYAENR